jgi:hypothetical protein
MNLPNYVRIVTVFHSIITLLPKENDHEFQIKNLYL